MVQTDASPGTTTAELAITWSGAITSNIFAWLDHGNNFGHLNHAIGGIAGLLAIYISVRRIVRDRRKNRG